MVKKHVLGAEFKESVDRLIEQIKRQKDIIIKSYGPLMLQNKKHEPPLYQISKELDPVGHKWIKNLNEASVKLS
jgi:hypothetical protein